VSPPADYCGSASAPPLGSTTAPPMSLATRSAWRSSVADVTATRSRARLAGGARGSPSHSRTSVPAPRPTGPLQPQVVLATLLEALASSRGAGGYRPCLRRYMAASAFWMRKRASVASSG
jgi:hypothetical protein